MRELGPFGCFKRAEWSPRCAQRRLAWQGGCCCCCCCSCSCMYYVCLYICVVRDESMCMNVQMMIELEKCISQSNTPSKCDCRRLLEGNSHVLYPIMYLIRKLRYLGKPPTLTQPGLAYADSSFVYGVSGGTRSLSTFAIVNCPSLRQKRQFDSKRRVKRRNCGWSRIVSSCPDYLLPGALAIANSYY